MKTMDKILIIVGISLAVFTVTMIVLFCLFREIPDTLCTCFYSAFGGECGVMGIIQMIKTKYNKVHRGDGGGDDDAG